MPFIFKHPHTSLAWWQVRVVFPVLWFGIQLISGKDGGGAGPAVDIGAGNGSFTAQFVTPSDGVSHILAWAELSLACWHRGQLALWRGWHPTAAAPPEPADSP